MNGRHTRQLRIFFWIGSLLIASIQVSLAQPQGNCCGGISAFDNGATIIFGCPGTPSITTDVRVDCEDESGSVTSSSTVAISANGQCHQLPSNCSATWKECRPTQEIADTSTASQHSYTVTVFNSTVDTTPANACNPTCELNSGTAKIRNCPCADCGDGGDPGSPGGGCEPGEENVDTSGCGSPILISIRGNRLELTDLDGGVRFDLDGDGFPERLSWTAEGADDAFLVLDRNGNGKVDDGTELFGNFTPQPPSRQPNGFLALAVFDLPANGGNHDGRISADDAIFGELGLWIDWNHNGISDRGELRRLSRTRIEVINLDYRESQRQDQYGNSFRYYSVVGLSSDSRGPRRKFAIDVFFLREP